LFTDGITEAVNPLKEEFGDSLLLDTLLNNRTSTTTDLVSSLFSAVDSFARGEAQADDITCVAIRRIYSKPQTQRREA
jgi:sigma-B regulation protein RsbU (phosphoserine phosphatase)